MHDIVLFEAAVVIEKFAGTTARCWNEQTIVQAVFQRLNIRRNG